jgi:hypothetical protein
VPSWIKYFLGEYAKGVRYLLSWFQHDDNAWENWVDASLHELLRNLWQVYITLTDDQANFSYFVASFASQSRQWVEWLAYERIPNGVKVAELYAYLQARSVRLDARAARAQLRSDLTKLINQDIFTVTLKIQQEVINRRAAIDNLRTQLMQVINQDVFDLAAAIELEVQNRRAAIARVRVYIGQQVTLLTSKINAIIPAINKAAVAGYNSVRPQQSSLLDTALTDLATDNPAVKDLVSGLVKILLDLASVDDPVERIAGQLLLSQIIDRLGVDKLAGTLVNNLVSEFLGTGTPTTLQQVEASVATRLANLESQWQQFYANGGDDIENLGNQMRTSSGLIFTGLMGGFLAAEAIAVPLFDFLGILE